MKRKDILLTLVLFAVILGLITGCAATTPPSQPTLTAVAPTLPPPPTSPPAPTSAAPGNGMPARENHSLVNGKVLAVAPDSQNPAMVRVQLTVTASTPVQNFASRTQDKIGQEVAILVTVELAKNVQVGNSIQLQVSFRGDEAGGNFFGSNLTIIQ